MHTNLTLSEEPETNSFIPNLKAEDLSQGMFDTKDAKNGPTKWVHSALNSFENNA